MTASDGIQDSEVTLLSYRMTTMVVPRRRPRARVLADRRGPGCAYHHLGRHACPLAASGLVCDNW